ncbi:PepSY domain-containing protein [Niallia sp. 01092]|uniref:PepSY domain-containing protein n=1 Tax=unclassified Niallia TaxID=2837522 RepID=UPI003FD3D741
MNWKSFLAGIGVGITTAYIATEVVAKNNSLSSDDVLNMVKKQWKEQAPITGSWINMQKELYEQANASYYVYKGGITTKKQNGVEQIEFIADSKTGRILDYHPITD